MEFKNGNPLLVSYLVEKEKFKNEPVVFLDVGCSGGIDDVWRQFRNQIEVHAFDPQQSEIARLTEQEENPNIYYHPCFIGVTNDDTGKYRSSSCGGYFDPQEPWRRSSAATISTVALENQHQSNPIRPQSNPINENLTPNKISLDDFIGQLEEGRNLYGADFIKIDCDGGDLEALMSCQKNLSPLKSILGFMVECNFTGSADSYSNTFHNIDRLLKTYGYQPIVMSINKYSRSALPKPFMYDICAQTKSGPVIWGDVLFILDGGAIDFAQKTGRNLTNLKLLKLAALYDLFSLQDCAAELLINYRARLENEVDIDLMLDLLSKEIAPEFEGYKSYMQAIKDDPSMLFPKNEVLKAKKLFEEPIKALSGA
jgi:FkbM family methyltransferase